MKKIIYIISAALLLAGCNFLDFDETSGIYNREDMYKTYSNIQKMLTNIYGYMPGKDIVDISDAMRDCGSDDAEFGDPSATVQRYNNGNWSALSTVDTQWSLYNAIRSVNEFLESIETVDLSLYKYDAKYSQWLEHLKYYPYEARLLRAYYLFELARRYGDIPVPDRMLSIEEANSIAKTPFDEVIEYIVKECDECAANLPTTFVGMLDNEYGRVTKGFAMAVKSKALLYAASPLFNASGDNQKWLDAAKAALALIDSGLYRLDPAEKANNFSQSPEVVMQILRSESSSFERYNFPVRFTEGKRTYMSGTYPTQNLVDAFQTAAGYDITLTADGWQTADPNFDVTRPYEGRDPRFARAVLANGMSFKGSKIETFVGGADYSATRADLGTPTGYYLRRYIQEETSFTPEAELSKKHSRIVYRYAETLLSYAEAANEYFHDPDKTDGTLRLSARQAINQVRANAGMPEIKVTGYEAFKEAVQREWRVEFAFEDHRFWDVRRWKIGSATQGQIDGVNILKVGDKLEYSRVMVERRTWADRMYLYPIPQKELFCNENLNPQNSGW
ncbi:MAG: RagB/SusD family nutrient uptake outer membrane protein [Bacteroidales bacterium]|nr:RagB/SusD family nutrient uptake outer membrane protein [Bacteroidales bacterium]MBR5072057.1 RagB/SusD family nutrient uptake outer membrane protein [Bacteroidales bacterium]